MKSLLLIAGVLGLCAAQFKPVSEAYYDETAGLVIIGSKMFIESESSLLAENAPAVQEPIVVHHEERRYVAGSYEFWVMASMSLALVLFAGIMSGLTVGYCGIDRMDLELKKKRGTPEEKAAADRVIPIIEKHHYLLVTLLISNACCMEALPIFLDSIVPSYMAIIISVTAILFFGEVIPQAICTGPNQIKIAAFLAPLVNTLMIVLGIIAYPIAKLLDWILGEHKIERYSNNDLKALVEMHTVKALKAMEDSEMLESHGLRDNQADMIKGVIDIKEINVK